MGYGFNQRLCVEALEALKAQLTNGSDPYEKHFKILAIDEQLAWFKKDELNYLVAKQGGGHYGAVRQWIQWNAVNGSDVTWGSQDVVRLKVPVTFKLLEELACVIATGVINDLKGRS